MAQAELEAQDHGDIQPQGDQHHDPQVAGNGLMGRNHCPQGVDQVVGVLLAGPVADFSAFMLSVVLVGIELKKQKNDM